MEEMDKLNKLLSQMERKQHMMTVIGYDMETAAPEGGLEEDGKDMNELSSELFAMEKSEEFISLVETIHAGDMSSLSDCQKRLINRLHKTIQDNKNVTPELDQEMTETYNNAYITWLKAKEDNSYEEYKDTLKKIYEVQKKVLMTRDGAKEEKLYDILFSDYENGFTSADLDTFFDELEKGIIPLYQKVRNANYTPRHDFLTRPVNLAKQQEFTEFLLKFNQFNLKRGSVSTTEHPFTSTFSKNDTRVTTHYFETNFISNMYSIIHEGGHALFSQNIPSEVYDSHLGENALTMGKHESVSRFYENIVGRSKAYIHAIYPSFQKLFKEEMGDVSEADFYEGVNYVDLNNAVRTEADELTYSLHIIIRYRIEREIMSGKADFNTLNQKWNQLYKDLLGIDVKDDKTGILQDVHWTSGFGYFPTYALGNALNCIYVKKLDKDIGFEKTVSNGDMKAILAWMKENVFKKAALMDTKDWIKEITGEDFSAKPYVDYLTKKYTELYHLN